MQPYLKTVAVRPKTDALRHYLELEAECKNAFPPADVIGTNATAPNAVVSAGGAAELMDTILSICLPPIHRSNCDACNERPWTHRNDYQGIETYVCDVCSP